MSRDEFLNLLPQLAANYQPAKEVLQQINKVNLLMIIGPSGVGKTTLIKILGLPYVASDTTRIKRPDEIEGADYFFREDYGRLLDEIKQKLFVQIAVGSGGDFYGTRAAAYPSNGWANMAVVADVIPVFRQLGFRSTVSAFITPPSYEEWQRRLAVHSVSPEQIQKRLAEARRSFSFAISDKQVNLILNDDVSEAKSQIQQLLEGKVDNARAKKAKQSILQIMDRL